jgi:RNA polymerase sigma-70 factor (ECF subfamily)
VGVTGEPERAEDQRPALLALYDRAVPQVYGYLAPRVGDVTLAEDLTSETFFAAATAVDRGTVPELTVAWLIAVARNKMVDHWRKAEREQRALRLVHDEDDADDAAAEAGLHFEQERARAVLARLGPHHRAALTLRYFDALSVPETAAELGRTVHATEALLVRARRAFKTAYLEGELDAG